MHHSHLDWSVDCLFYYRSHTVHERPWIGHLSHLWSGRLRDLDISYVQGLQPRNVQAAHHRRYGREDGQQVAVAEASSLARAVRPSRAALFFWSCSFHAFHLTSFSCPSTLKGFVPAFPRQEKPKGPPLRHDPR